MRTLAKLSLKDKAVTFRQNAWEFCRHPRIWLAYNGANLAGTLWISGDFLQLILGAVTLSLRIIISSVINFAASSGSVIFGKKDIGVAVNSVLAILGTGVFLGPSLIEGDLRTCIGYAGFCASVSFGIFGEYLSKKFVATENSFLRATLGRPRRVMGLALFFSRLPIIVSAVAQEQWTVVIPFVAWSLGDLSMSFSREEIATKSTAV